MPTLSLTVSNEVATRIQAAYGASSLADLKTKIVNDLKSYVANYEVNTVIKAEQTKVQQAQEAMDLAINTINTTVQSEIVVT